jgi:hypothetical protein
LDIALRGEKIQFARTIEYVYSPDRQKEDGKSAEEILALMLRGGELAALLMNNQPASAPASAPKIEFATSAEMSTKTDEILLRLAELAKLPCEERLEQINLVYRETENLPDKFVLARSVATAFAQCMRSECSLKSEIDGTLLMVAIELYRAARGHLPASLAELLPNELPALPLDCRTAKSFLYRLSDDQRKYTLYTTGADLIDDGGKLMVDDNHLALSERGLGFDYILSPPRERHMEAIDQDQGN